MPREGDFVEHPERRKPGRPTKEEMVRRRYDPELQKPKQASSLGKRPSKSDVAKMLEHAVAFRKMGKIKLDRNNAKEIEKRIDKYLEYCIKYDIKPTVESMALSLGIERTTLYRWKEGQHNIPEASSKAIRDGYNLMNDILAQCLVDGKINPVAAFFLLKNNHGYKDQTDVVVAAENPYVEKNPDDVRNKYLEGVPEEIEGEGTVV